ncbi:MAG: ABC transporter permease [Candidatus Latescibacteria bacterium]|nr:ABC transporter permease [Candidatus Latescibacterota bacterium]
MIRHLLRLCWNRKTSQLLLGLELLISFLILTTLCTLAFQSWVTYHLPLGFEYRHVWSVRMEREKGQPSPADSAAMQQVYQLLKGTEGVEGVAEDSSPPFDRVHSSAISKLNGQSLQYQSSSGSDDLAAVLRLDLVAGRWFSPEDDGIQERPVVLNQRLASYLFGNQDPVGRLIAVGENTYTRVVGVLSDHRCVGPFEPPSYVMLGRAKLDRPVRWNLPTSFLIRLRPGTPRQLERRLVDQLQAVAPGWTTNIIPLEEGYLAQLRGRLSNIRSLVAIVGAILFLVVLGLVGVMWQNVTRRTREIGIRRAAGATRAGIYGQIVGEMLMLTTLAILVGVVLVVQAAVLDFFPSVSVGVYAAGLCGGAMLLYLFITTATLYPGWLATRIQPAQALHCD